MTRVLVLGGVSYNLMLYVNAFPSPRPHTVFARDYHETLGGTAAGKALNLQKLGVDEILSTSPKISNVFLIIRLFSSNIALLYSR